MRLALALVALLALTPLATAQAPEDPVGIACDVVGSAAPDARDAIPVCARAEPAAPQQGEEEDASQHQHASPAPSPEQGAADLAQQAQDAVQSIPEDPAGAPNRVAALVASVVQVVRDLLDVPAVVGGAIDGAITGALDGIQKSFAVGADATASGLRGVAQGVADAGHAAIEGTRRAAHAAVDGVRSFLGGLRPDAPAAPVRDAPSIDRAAPAADGLLRGVTSLLD